MVKDCVAGEAQLGDVVVRGAEGGREYDDGVAEDVVREANDLGPPGVVALGRDELDLWKPETSACRTR